MWSPFLIGLNFDVSISTANWVANDRNRRQTAVFGILWPLLTGSGKFRRVAETSFCKGGTTRAIWSPFAIGPNFQVWITPANRATIGINSKKEDLAASGLCWHEQGSFEELQKLRFAKGDHEPCGPPFLSGLISTCKYLLQIEWRTIGIGAKQDDFAASGLFWHDHESMKNLSSQRHRLSFDDSNWALMTNLMTTGGRHRANQFHYKTYCKKRIAAAHFCLLS